MPGPRWRWPSCGQTWMSDADFAAFIQRTGIKTVTTAGLPRDRAAEGRTYCEPCGFSVLTENYPNHLEGAQHQRKAARAAEEGR